MEPQARRGWLGLLAGAALTLLAGRWLSGLYADWAFHRALGVDALWHTKTLYTTALALLAFACVTAFALANFYAVRQSIVSLVLPQRIGNIEIAEAIPTSRLTGVAVALAVLVGVVFAALPHDWRAAVLAWDRTGFGELEPYLDRDLGFYVQWLPWERQVLVRAAWAFATVSAMVIGLYASTPSVRWDGGRLHVSTWVRRHLAVLLGVAVLLLGWTWRLDRYGRLLDAFTDYDRRVTVPYLGALSFATIPVAAVVAWALWRAQRRTAVAILSLLVLAGPVGLALLTTAARTDQPSAESGPALAYQRTHALYTRRAYGVEEIAHGDTAAIPTLTEAAVARAVPEWEPAALIASAVANQRVGDDTGAVYVAWQTLADGVVPRLFRVRDLPGVVVHPGAARYAVVADSVDRIAAPPFATTVDRLLHAWALQDPRLVFRDPPTPRPRLVTAAALTERLARVAPFLTPGPTHTPLLRGDTLYWVTELFVTSADYPLSESRPLLGATVRYARHAATAVVQAQIGRVWLVPVARPDAVMRAWMRRVPSLFVADSLMPSWWPAARPPAVDVARVQGSALAAAGFQSDTSGTRRMVRADNAGRGLAEGEVPPFRADSTGALAWSVPTVVEWTDRLGGLLIARGGRNRRTEYFPARGPSPQVVLEALQAAMPDSESVRAHRRGRLQGIPTARGATRGVTYVQRVYEWPERGAPQVASVVTYDAEHGVRVGQTLAEALGLAAARSGPQGGDVEFRRRVAELYRRMEAALKAGDWEAYGRAWAELGEVVGRR